MMRGGIRLNRMLGKVGRRGGGMSCSTIGGRLEERYISWMVPVNNTIFVDFHPKLLIRSTKLDLYLVPSDRALFLTKLIASSCSSER